MFSFFTNSIRAQRIYYAVFEFLNLGCLLKSSFFNAMFPLLLKYFSVNLYHGLINIRNSTWKCIVPYLRKDYFHRIFKIIRPFWLDGDVSYD